jgi:type 2 lantibiotic biosynthesis protein LanM
VIDTWAAALTLGERWNLLCANPALATAVDEQVAERRFKRWQSEKVFLEDASLLQERLADGLAEKGLRALLGIPPAEFKQCIKPPTWAAAHARTCEDPAACEGIAQLLRDSLAHSAIPSGFLAAVEGLMALAHQELRSALSPMASAEEDFPYDPETIGSLLLRDLSARLGVIHRTLVLELNVARIENQLDGETPQQRFESFIARLRRPEVALALWEEYPVLARQVAISLDQWLETSLEFLHRLVADWQPIREYFFQSGRPGLVVKVTSSGDRHRDGRSVHIVEFSSGGKLVYKPRPLSLDQHFQDLISWINERATGPQFRTLTLLSRPGYGWTEYVDSAPCDNETQVRRFYERQGGLLALLYALRATDFHFENVIACGEHPVLVDLETLLHPDLDDKQTGDAGAVANKEIMNSVFRAGLLPFRFAANDEQREGAEISGLGGARGQKTPYPVLLWEGEATDEMRAVRRRIEIPPQRNRPRLKQETDVSALDYTEELISGFAATYKLLENHRGELLSPRGPLHPFVHDTVRCVLRPTSTYGALLTESFHPNLLRDALDRERFFDNLWADTVWNPLLKRTVELEREDLWVGDIPIFTTSPGSDRLYDSRGRMVEGHRHEPSFSLMQQRLRQLSHEDLDRQTWFIRAAMTALGGQETARTRAEESGKIASTMPTSLVDPQASEEDLLKAAISIGERLNQSAIQGARGEVTWIGVDMVSAQDPFWELCVTGSNLYGGLSGIGLFLAYLGHISGTQLFRDLARQAVTTILNGLEDATEKGKGAMPLGAFTGLGGVIHFLVHCGALWRDHGLIGKAEELAGYLEAIIPADKSLDVIGGCAGLIAVLLGLNKLRPSKSILDLAESCGDHLLRNKVEMANGVGWITISEASQPLTGFSHGAAGIAWALMKLAAASGQCRFREAAIAALDYERSLFSSAHNNWPDLRGFSQKGETPTYARAWCHGAPGIGLGRLGMLDHYEDPEIHMEIDAALRTTSERPFGASHCLCHGDLGNFETLLVATQTNNKHECSWSAEKVRRLSAEILASGREHGWVCGLPLGTETPGLMVGTAGIGYGLLRLAFPGRIPSALSLAPPWVEI